MNAWRCRLTNASLAYAFGRSLRASQYSVCTVHSRRRAPADSLFATAATITSACAAYAVNGWVETLSLDPARDVVTGNAKTSPAQQVSRHRAAQQSLEQSDGNS